MEPLFLKDDFSERTLDVPQEQIVQSSIGKGWQGIDLAEIIHPLDDFALPALSQHTLVVNLGDPSLIQEQLAQRQGNLGTGNLVILPAGAPSTWHVEHGGEARHLHLYLAPSLIKQIAAFADMNPDMVELIDAIGVADAQVETIALSYLTELRTGGLGGKMYLESLTNLLVIHLLRHYSSLKQSPPARSGKLTGMTLRFIKTYIEDHLTTDLTLTSMAAAVHLSPYHFARLFKASFGLTPHQYVIHRRVERAKLLMTTTSWSLTTIAHMAGFANESHLSFHFKRLTGFTPKQAR